MTDNDNSDDAPPEIKRSPLKVQKELSPLQKKLIDCGIIAGCILALAYVPAIISNVGKVFQGSPNHASPTREQKQAAQAVLQEGGDSVVFKNPVCVISQGIVFDNSKLREMRTPHLYVVPPDTTALERQIKTAKAALAAVNGGSGTIRTLTEEQKRELRSAANINVLTDPYERVAMLGVCFSTDSKIKKFYENLQVARGHQIGDTDPVQVGERIVANTAKGITDTVGNAMEIAYKGLVLLTGGATLLMRASRD
jgi:hypothetical protein